MRKILERAQRSGIRDMDKRRDIRSSQFFEQRLRAWKSLPAVPGQDFRVGSEYMHVSSLRIDYRQAVDPHSQYHPDTALKLQLQRRHPHQLGIDRRICAANNTDAVSSVPAMLGRQKLGLYIQDSNTMVHPPITTQIPIIRSQGSFLAASLGEE